MDNNQREYRTVIVHGPPGCGKTHHAADLARALGCCGVVDDWMPFQPGPHCRPWPLVCGHLHMTNIAPPYTGDVPERCLIMPFAAAQAAAFVVGAL